jgi:hypothetical protein
MLQFNEWNKTTVQVGLEGAVFIYVHRMPFAVRESGTNKITFVNMIMCQTGTPALECLEKMRLMRWELVDLMPDEFRAKAKEIYYAAILNSARRIGMECINLKENTDVDNEQDSPGHIKDRNAWNRRARQKALDRRQCKLP